MFILIQLVFFLTFDLTFGINSFSSRNCSSILSTIFESIFFLIKIEFQGGFFLFHQTPIDFLFSFCN